MQPFILSVFFNSFINDLEFGVGCLVTKFAKDTELFEIVEKLNEDLLILVKWATTYYMLINVR